MYKAPWATHHLKKRKNSGEGKKLNKSYGYKKGTKVQYLGERYTHNTFFVVFVPKGKTFSPPIHPTPLPQAPTYHLSIGQIKMDFIQCDKMKVGDMASVCAALRQLQKVRRTVQESVESF